MHRRKQSFAGIALHLLFAVAVIHNGIAGEAAAESAAMATDSMSMAHHGHDGMHEHGETGESCDTSGCCDDPGCGCGCTAPQACLMIISHSGPAPVRSAAIAPFPGGLLPTTGLAAPFRPPA